MKGAIFATAAAALMGSAVAARHQGHEIFHRRNAAAETCGCTTKVITYYGEPTLVPIQSPSSSAPAVSSSSTLTTTLHSTSYTTVTVTSKPSVAPVSSSTPSSVAPVASSPALPTPAVSTFHTPGTYTIPATTVTVSDTTTVCGATSTSVPSGTHTWGGVTTVVETSTTVVCPYATVKPTGSTVTSVIETTTYVCPAAGTYTVVPPTTSVVPTSTVIVYPTPATITPGTYTQTEQVVTVTETDYTYVCPFSTGLASTTAPVVPSTTAPAVAATTAPSSSAAPSVPASSVASSSSPASTAGSSTSIGEIVGGSKYGITYSPYTNQGGCKEQGDIESDVAEIKAKGFSAIRIYSTDCNGLEYIGGAAEANSLKLIIGVYIASTGIEVAKPQVDAIVSWGKWELVDLIVVGNEAVFSTFCSASDLAAFITEAKGKFSSAGYNGMVTTTEPLNIWQESSGTLCDVVDITGGNIHPFFNADVSALDAGSFTKSQMQILKDICPGKGVVNLETGWPHSGESNGLAIPSIIEQGIALLSIMTEVGGDSVLLSFSDDLWKGPGEFGVEQSWGCINAIVGALL